MSWINAVLFWRRPCFRRGRILVSFGTLFARLALADPALEYSTFFGGTGDEGAARVAIDALGNVYVAATTTSPDFPTTAGMSQQLGGQQDGFVAKFSPQGALVYSTYLGGPCDDEIWDIDVDSVGNAYITGRIGLCHFSTVKPGVFVAKLNSQGEFIYQYTFGGDFGELWTGLAITIDADGNAYVAGTAISGNLPTTPGAFRTDHCGGFLGDGFVAKVNSEGTGLVYCTYLCGSLNDSPNAIAVDSAGNAYIAGSTVSRDFPVVNSIQSTNGAVLTMPTAFVSKLSADGSKLIFSTYLGGTTRDIAYALTVDNHGNVYVTGETIGGQFRTTPGAVQIIPPSPLCYYGGLCSDAFLAKLTGDGALVYSTLLAGEGDDVGHAIAVDAEENVYVAGATVSGNFPIRKAFQVEHKGVGDVFLAKLNADASRIIFSTYFGGGKLPNSTALTEGVDRPGGIALDGAGNIWVAGNTVSFDFPVTPDAVLAQAPLGHCYLAISPCGNSFLARIEPDAVGRRPELRLEVNPAETSPGGIIAATWAGIAVPKTNDLLVLYRLGDGTDSFATVFATYHTTGAAAGTLDLQLPDPLEPGSYELRLLSEENALYGVIARSEPLIVRRTVAPAVRLEPAIEAGDRLRLRVTGLTPGIYRLEAAADLNSPEWRVIATAEIAIDDSVEFTEIIDSALNTRFYRVSR